MFKIENGKLSFYQWDINQRLIIEEPIPNSGNMALESGKHYMQDYVIYLRNRDTVIPVYQSLKDLVGLDVEVI